MNSELDRAREEDGESRGPNLTVIYTLIVTALLLAIGVALLVVVPLYRHRH
jgi:hypothetical protein